MTPFNLFGKKPRPRLGLALGGGGARGLAHIVFLQVLDELGIRPSVIAGTSMGALIGALYAFGHNGVGIERIFSELNLVSLIIYADVALGATHGLLRGEKIIQTLDRLVKHQRFADLRIPLKVVATDFWSREEVVITQGSVAEAVRASISIPGIFEPVVTAQRVLIDGGMVDSVPYERIRADCDVLVAINVLGDPSPVPQPLKKPNIYEAILTSFQIMEAANVETKLGRSRPDLLVSPKLHGVNILDFHKLGSILESVTADAAQFKQDLLAIPRLVRQDPPSA
jgi:NTE family protein